MSQVIIILPIHRGIIIRNVKYHAIWSLFPNINEWIPVSPVQRYEQRVPLVSKVHPLQKAHEHVFTSFLHTGIPPLRFGPPSSTSKSYMARPTSHSVRTGFRGSKYFKHSLQPCHNPLHLARSSPNIVVFGQTGAGKSSLINMLARSEVVSVSNKLGGNTTAVQEVKISWDDRSYTIWDTPGLNEGEKGNVPTREAMDQLYKLVKTLGSVSLVIYCICGSRLTEIARVNYDLFWRIVCKEEVPIVLVVTGLEQESNMDAWWTANRKIIKKMEMTFAGHACVTTTKGKNDIYKRQYWESEKKVWKLVGDCCRLAPWKVKPEELEEVGKEMDAYMNRYTKRHRKGWTLLIVHIVRLFRRRAL